MFLDERLTHKCSLIKRSLVRFADQSVPKALLLLCEYLVSALNVLSTVFVLIFHRINFSSSAITPCHVLSRVKSSRMLITCKLANCGCTKKKTKPKFQLGRFLWKARVINRSFPRRVSVPVSSPCIKF